MARIKELRGIKGKVYSFVIILLFVNLIYVFYINRFLYFYFIFEISLIPIFLIITGWGYQPERLQAGFYIFIYTLLGSLPFLYCLMKINLLVGGFHIKIFFYELGFFGVFFRVSFLIVFIIKFPIFFVHL